MYRPTQRTFRDCETQEEFRLYMHDTKHCYKLIKDVSSKNLAAGTEVNGFYIAAHTSLDLKLNTKKIVHIDRGEFYNLKQNEDGVIEQPTHIKYCGFEKFTKISNNN